jgi:hypothetical protein
MRAAGARLLAPSLLVLVPAATVCSLPSASPLRREARPGLLVKKSRRRNRAQPVSFWEQQPEGDTEGTFARGDGTRGWPSIGSVMMSTAKSHRNPRPRMLRFSCLALFAGSHAAGNGPDPKTCEADRNAPRGMDVSGCFAELTILWIAS